MFEGACAPVLARLRFQVQIRKVKKKKLRGNRNLSSSSPAFDRLDGMKKETGEEANESETEEEENGRGGVACGGGSRLMLPGILDVICVQL